MLLAQQHPTWTPAQLKAALMDSARPNPSLTAFDQGAGRVDVAQAIEQELITTTRGLHGEPNGGDHEAQRSKSLRPQQHRMPGDHRALG